MRIRTNIISFITASLPFGTLAQEPNADALAAKYPDENGVFLNLTADVNITLDKSGNPLIGTNRNEERLFFNDNCRLYSEETIGYSSFVSVDDISANVQIPVAGKIKTLKITDFFDEDDMDASVFHDDNKIKKFYFTGLVPGAKTQLTYTENLKDPHFFGAFYFSSYLPVENSRYQITAPADMEILYETFGDEKDKISYRVVTEGKTKIHTWSANSMAAYSFEDNCVGIKYYATHVVVRIGNYQFQNETRHVIRNLDDLYSYYRNFVRDVNQQPCQSLESLADSLTAGLTTPSEKVSAIFYWVQDNIKYVAFEAGYEGLIPREAEMIYNRRFGDCKDMSSILYKMINSIGIQAYYTWIGTRDIPYGYSQVPTPMSDNHMICAFHDGEKYVFLDATGKGIPFGLTTPFIQEKEALIGIDDNKYEVIRVPVVKKNQNLVIDSVFAYIEDKTLSGKGKTHYTGFNATFLAEELSNMTQTDIEDAVSRLYVKGNNKCKTELTEMRGLDQRGGPLEVDYSFDVPDYLLYNGDEIYINPFLNKHLSGTKIDAKDKLDKENHFHRINHSVVQISVPDGYALSYVPADFTFENPAFSCSVRYKPSSDRKKIEVSISFTYEHLVLKKNDFGTWNDMIRKLNSSYAETIIFKKS